MIKTFHVIFNKADTIKWWMKGLDREMSHVWLIEETKLGAFTCLIRSENLHNVIDNSVHLYEFSDYKTLIDLQDIKYKLITIKLDVDPLKDFNPINILSCVSLTKKIMGINKPLIITPKQLYNYLRRTT